MSGSPDRTDAEINVQQPSNGRQRRMRKRSNLAGMNWRRGLLLAGIHLAVVVPLMVMLEVQDEAYIREHYAPQKQTEDGPPAWTASDPALKNAPSGGEEQTIILDPCAMTFHYRPQQKVPRFVNIPAAVLSGWEQECPPRWSLAGRLKVGYLWAEPPSMVPARRTVNWGFAFLIAIQWMLVGGFPLGKPKRWWLEPSAFITICAVLGFALLLIPLLREVALIPATFAALAWLWWFGLLVWKGGQFGWRLVAHKHAAAS
jgi:hypothetical protein